ncbi:PspA/IM30 family protein [Bacillus kwashiorkori]|uniref:PspA/IM30 family protein n=1 Tax=Bacillus kwashiorkori TaxID=1522318 RepID=UPI00078215CD|nr:PspA/IM30 family protein [Bacillus kwashiorkori]
MGILARFKDIMASNIHALLDKAEDPEKMVDQYLRNLNSDLGKVKAETASIMAEEQRAKRALEECQSEVEKMEGYAIKALTAGNEADARKFLERKAVYAQKEADLQTAYELAANNAKQMRQMHDKLVADINELESRRAMIKGKAAIAKTQQRMNKIGSSISGANQSISAFSRMEEKVNRQLDEAKAMAELNSSPVDEMKDLTAKYESHINVDNELEQLKAKINGDSKIDDELAALKEKMKNNE